MPPLGFHATDEHKYYAHVLALACPLHWQLCELDGLFRASAHMRLLCEPGKPPVRCSFVDLTVGFVHVFHVGP